MTARIDCSLMQERASNTQDGTSHGLPPILTYGTHNLPDCLATLDPQSSLVVTDSCIGSCIGAGFMKTGGVPELLFEAR
jgi:hypothetical protein